MILKIILLFLFFVILALILFFLSCILVPAVKEQTTIKENMLFSKIEHKFSKLEEDDDVEKIEPTGMKAFVKCSCNKTFEKDRNLKIFNGQTCELVYSLYGSNNFCSFSCIGLGDCKKVCTQKSIVIKNGTAVIGDFCNGCGNCVKACPKGIITLIPEDQKKEIACSNTSDDFTTCSCFQKEEKVERPEKKLFKIWRYCYKLLFRT